MSNCDVNGCEKDAVADLTFRQDGLRCPRCLEYDGQERGWW